MLFYIFWFSYDDYLPANNVMIQIETWLFDLDLGINLSSVPVKVINT